MMFVKSLIFHKKVNQIHAQLIKTQTPQTLNQLLKSLTNSNDPKNALLMYNQMLIHNIHNHYTFTYALKASTKLRSYVKDLEIHAHVTKTGHLNDIFVQNTLLHFYVTQNDVLVSASKLFDSIGFPNVVSWSLIVSGLCKNGFEEEAIFKFSSMDVEPNSFTLVSLVSACSNLKALNLGKSVHGYSLRNAIEGHDIILDNAILDFYTKCGSLESARQVFDKMRERDVFSWTTLIGGFAQRGLCEEAVKLFQRMIEGETEPNEVTLVNLLSACSSVGSLNLGEWIYSYILQKSEIAPNKNVCNALINMFVKCGHLGKATRVFNGLENKDVISWSSMIGGTAMTGRGRESLKLFALMLVNGVCPDEVTFVGLLSACSHAGLVKQGLTIFCSMRRVFGIEPRDRHYTCVVDMYGRAGLLKEAEAFLKEMPIQADNAVLGALLNACKIHGENEMFERIQCRIVNGGGNGGTFALLSNRYAETNRWDDANNIRDEMSRLGVKKPIGSSWIEDDTEL